MTAVGSFAAVHFATYKRYPMKSLGLETPM
jgi:hypothetical protein